MSTPIIRVDRLNRSFGKLRAVADLSFAIEPGQVVGFIGANGAGKTTTMRMMVTLEYPDSGYIEIDGLNVRAHPSEVRRRVGWMPDYFGTYPNMDVLDYMDFFARANGLKGKERQQRIDEVLDFTGLDRLAERPTLTLSKGEKQRLSLGRTLLSDPKVLVLDEPAAGLDPKARMEFKNLVRLLQQQGKTLFISSHILSELGEMCNTLLFIDAGRLKYHGEAEKLTSDHAAGLVVRVLLRNDPARLAQWVEQQTQMAVRETLPKGALLNLVVEDADHIEGALADLLKRMTEAGLEVFEFQREQRRLEEAFIDMLREPTGVN
ncbi:MAG: ABC transporter ATP-binding protein [Opitutales bacterium]